MPEQVGFEKAMSDAPKPELYVDEDWKSRVEREKTEAAQTTASAQQSPSAAAGESSRDAGRRPPPEADLSLLITSLATQAMLSLGQFPHPTTNQVEKDLPQAGHLIDLLGVLDEKTRGNRTPDESALLEQVLHELRMIYVRASR